MASKKGVISDKRKLAQYAGAIGRFCALHGLNVVHAGKCDMDAVRLQAFRGHMEAVAKDRELVEKKSENK